MGSTGTDFAMSDKHILSTDFGPAPLGGGTGTPRPESYRAPSSAAFITAGELAGDP